MTFDEYQREAMRTAGPAEAIEHVLCLSALGIAGEGGEVCDLIKKHLYHGHILLPHEIRQELGDLLWYIARMCEAFQISLEGVAISNIRKLELRYPDGFSKERSIHREEYQTKCSHCGVAEGTKHDSSCILWDVCISPITEKGD